MYALTEVVLAVMLRSFVFSLGKKEIYWNWAGVNFPTVGRENSKPEMYLRVAPLKA